MPLWFEGQIGIGKPGKFCQSCSTEVSCIIMMYCVRLTLPKRLGVWSMAVMLKQPTEYYVVVVVVVAVVTIYHHYHYYSGA